MPIYEYRCDACGHELEALHKMSDPPLRDCPACNAAELVKKVSAAAFRLKGGGWYETDFKKDGQRNLAGDKGGASKSSDSGSTDTAKSADSKSKAADKPASKPSSGSSAAA